MKHKHCKNYINGYCKLKNIVVDPEGKACRFFQPKEGIMLSQGPYARSEAERQARHWALYHEPAPPRQFKHVPFGQTPDNKGTDWGFIFAIALIGFGLFLLFKKE